MVDWAATTGQHIVQLLPINDTTGSKTWRDSYPYSAISVFALHPIYLGLKDFPLKDSKKQAAYLSEAKKLNDLKDVDYEKALHLKLKYCRDLFDQEAENILPSAAYRTFCKENESWLFLIAAIAIYGIKTIRRISKIGENLPDMIKRSSSVC